MQRIHEQQLCGSQHLHSKIRVYPNCAFTRLYLALPSFTCLYSTKLDCATMKEANRSQKKRKIQFTSTHPPHLTSHSSRPMGGALSLSPKMTQRSFAPLIEAVLRSFFSMTLGNTKDVCHPQSTINLWYVEIGRSERN